MAAADDGVEDLLTGRVQHADNTNEGKVVLIEVELVGVAEVHLFGLHGVVRGGEGQATEGVTAGTVLAGQVQDAVLQGGGQRHLLGAHTGVRAAIKHTLGCALDEQLGSVADAGRLQGDAVGRHGLAVTRELQGELLLPLALHVTTDDDGASTAVQTILGDVEGVHLLSQDDQGGLSSLTDLLEGLLELVEIDGRVVAHDADGTHLLQSLVVVGLDLLTLQEHVTNGLVGGASDLELEEAAVVAFNLVEHEHAADGHLVGGQGTGLVGADDGGATQGLDGGQGAHNSVLLGHAAGTQSQASGNDGGQTLGDGGDGQGDGDLEVVDGTLGAKDGTTVRTL